MASTAFAPFPLRSGRPELTWSDHQPSTRSAEGGRHPSPGLACQGHAKAAVRPALASPLPAQTLLPPFRAAGIAGLETVVDGRPSRARGRCLHYTGVLLLIRALIHEKNDRCPPTLLEIPVISAFARRPRAVNAAAQSEYARLAGMSQTALTAAVEPYLPIARVWVLRSGAIPTLREQLIQRIEAALRPQD